MASLQLNWMNIWHMWHMWHIWHKWNHHRLPHLPGHRHRRHFQDQGVVGCLVQFKVVDNCKVAELVNGRCWQQGYRLREHHCLVQFKVVQDCEEAEIGE